MVAVSSSVAGDHECAPEIVRRRPPVAAAPPDVARVLPGKLLWLLLGMGTPFATALAGLALWHEWRADWPQALAATALFAALLACGLVLLAEPHQTAPGVVMMAAALCLVLSLSQDWPGPFPYLATVLSYAWLVLIGWALYRYPERRLSAGDRTLWLVAGSWCLLLPVVIGLVSRPEWHGFPAASWWVSPWPDHAAFRAATEVQNVGLVGLAVVVVAGWVRRLRATRAAARRVKVPIAVAAVCGIGLAALQPVAAAVAAPAAVVDTLTTLATAAFLAIPVAFLVAVLRRQLAHTRLSGLVLQLRGQPSPEQVRTALRVALEDPQLDVYYWDAETAGYANDRGQTYRSTSGTADLVVAAAGTSGEPLALVVADQAGHRDPDLVQATVAAFSFGLENARLARQVHDQLDRLQAASERLVKSADAQRRALEQNLHDGVQQHFLALGLQLAVAEAGATDEPTRTALVEMRGQLRFALSELRSVVHGLRPDLLRLGLAGAVAESARRFPFPVELDIEDVDVPDTAELTAYFTVSEALANAAKHADPRRVQVSLRRQGTDLVIVVADDGRGGARPDAGTRGLTGIRDRVTALGGRFTLLSPPGRGTRITVVIPCG